MSSKYWDLDEVERGNLTDDQMKTVSAHALMEAGLLNPEPPVELAEEAPELPRVTLYRPKSEGRYGNSLNVAFATPEQAAEFIKLKPQVIESQWLGHSHVEVLSGKEDFTFEAVQVVPVAAMNARKSEVERYNANKAANVTARSEYDAARKKADESLSSIWVDQRRCQQLVRDIAKVNKTFAEYEIMCEGNLRMARQFLLKTFDRALVEKALGPEMPECIDVAAPASC